MTHDASMIRGGSWVNSIQSEVDSNSKLRVADGRVEYISPHASTNWSYFVRKRGKLLFENRGMAGVKGSALLVLGSEYNPPKQVLV